MLSMMRKSRTQFFYGATMALLTLAAPPANAEAFPYGNEAAVVQSCAANQTLEKCMCYLRQLEKRMTLKELGAAELAIATRQQIDKRVMEKLQEAQMECFN